MNFGHILLSVPIPKKLGTSSYVDGSVEMYSELGQGQYLCPIGGEDSGEYRVT